MKLFKINDSLTVVCNWEKTRYGFRHLASLLRNGGHEVAKAKACYYNRAWESFEYQSVLRNLKEKSGLNDSEIKDFESVIRGG